MTVLNWGNCENYEAGFYIGSDGDNGEHLRDASGWPYSIYRRASAIGSTDVVICHGIQSLEDATHILERLQALA